MKKQDRALKLKGFRQVNPNTEGAIVTTSRLKNKKKQVTKTITRGWLR